MTELAFQGLQPPIKDRFSSQEFESLGHLIQIISTHENRLHKLRKDKYQKRVANVQTFLSDSYKEEKVGLAEWTRNKNPVFCPWIKVSLEKLSLNITKADKIFDSTSAFSKSYDPID